MGEHDDDVEVTTIPEAASADAVRLVEALDRIASALDAIARAVETRTSGDHGAGSGGASRQRR